MKLKSHETSGKGTQKGAIPTASFSYGDITFIFEIFKDSIELRISRGKGKDKERKKELRFSVLVQKNNTIFLGFINLFMQVVIFQ
jgi:hypothetical protein